MLRYNGAKSCDIFTRSSHSDLVNVPSSGSIYVTNSGQRIEINNFSVKNVSKCKKLTESPPENDKIESKIVKSKVPLLSEKLVIVKQPHLLSSLNEIHADDVTNPLEIDFSEIVGSDICIDGFKGTPCKEDLCDTEDLKIDVK